MARQGTVVISLYSRRQVLQAEFNLENGSPSQPPPLLEVKMAVYRIYHAASGPVFTGNPQNRQS